MRETDPDYMRQLEKTARDIGNLIGEACKRTGQKWGFALMLFSFDGPEFTWISNARRSDMVRTMQEFISRNPPDQTSEERN